jgi:hypothetical protein
MSNAEEAQFCAIIGATGCGKTYELKKRLAQKKRNRTLVWSPKEPVDNYVKLFANSIIVHTASEVIEHLKVAGKKGSFHLVFNPSLNQKNDTALFNVVCKAVLAVGNITLIVEELHTVTTATHACDGWRQVNFMGRAYGVHVFGLSQRPASVDKAFLASLSSIHVGRLPYPADQKVIAEIIGMKKEDIALITGFGAIQKNMLTGKVTRK